MSYSPIANRIKELRQRRKMTLDQLSSLTGLSKGYLSRIENSSRPPPLFTLDAIARALGVDSTFLIVGTDKLEESNICLVRNDERRSVEREPNPYKYTYEALAYKKPGKNMEPYLITVGFHRDIVEYQHQGEEFFYGEKSFLVKEGDSLYFDASVPHSGVSISDQEAKILCIIYSYSRL